MRGLSKSKISNMSVMDGDVDCVPNAVQMNKKVWIYYYLGNGNGNKKLVNRKDILAIENAFSRIALTVNSLDQKTNATAVGIVLKAEMTGVVTLCLGMCMSQGGGGGLGPIIPI